MLCLKSRTSIPTLTFLSALCECAKTQCTGSRWRTQNDLVYLAEGAGISNLKMEEIVTFETDVLYKSKITHIWFVFQYNYNVLGCIRPVFLWC